MHCIWFLHPCLEIHNNAHQQVFSRTMTFWRDQTDQLSWECPTFWIYLCFPLLWINLSLYSVCFLVDLIRFRLNIFGKTTPWWHRVLHVTCYQEPCAVRPSPPLTMLRLMTQLKWWPPLLRHTLPFASDMQSILRYHKITVFLTPNGFAIY